MEVAAGTTRERRRTPPWGNGSIIGATVGGYRILNELGAGGMGVVYVAEHPVIRTRVAVKVLRADLAASPGIAQRFIREAQAVARVVHPNAVRIFDLTTLPTGQPCIVMELAEGSTLDAWLARGRFEPQRALSVLVQTGSAVGAAHQRGIVHRDVKPQNIVVLRSELEADCVKLLDFGLAHIVDEMGGTSSAMVGTPSYMAPEQIVGQRIDARTDVYALGVLGYRLLANRPPFEAPTKEALLKQHLADPPPPIPDIPEAIADVLMRALSKNPDDRYDDGHAFCRALLLASAAEGHQIATPAPVPSVPLWTEQDRGEAQDAEYSADVRSILAELGPDIRERISRDHYAFLSVPRDAEDETILSTTRRLEALVLWAYGVVSAVNRIELDELMAKLSAIRWDLLDPSRRLMYDAEIGNARGVERALGLGLDAATLSQFERAFAADKPGRIDQAMSLARRAYALADSDRLRALQLLEEALRNNPLSLPILRLFSQLRDGLQQK